MSLPNTTLWGDVLPGGPVDDVADGSVDVTEVVDIVQADLHAASRAELSPWWSEVDLYQWIDEGLKRLARECCVFVGVYNSTLSVSGTAQYAVPPRHVSTLHVSYADSTLRPATFLELEARDPAFETTEGTPDHWYQNLLGPSETGLAPVPDTSDDVIRTIYEGFPATVDSQDSLVAAPPPIKGFLGMYVLGEAYGREGEMEAPDIAAHCRARVDLYFSMLRHYYGAGK